MPFRVAKLPEKKEPLTNYNKSLPQPINGAFRVLVCAQSGGGKTNLMINMLLEMRKYFKKIVIFAPDLRQYIKHFKRKMTRHDQLYEGYEEAKVIVHYKKAVARNRQFPKKRTPTLFLFDDALDELQRSRMFQELMVVSRKEHVSIIITAHKFTMATPLARNNMTHFIVLSTNTMELRLIASYLGVEADKLISAWKHGPGSQRFEFLYIVANPATVFYSFTDRRLM